MGYATQEIKLIDQEYLDGIEEEKNYNQCFVFNLGKDDYGLKINQVREVNEYKKVFSVPQAPKFVRGVINLRGEVIPVVDLNERFWGKQSEITKFTSIVIVEIEDKEETMLVGIIIDAFREVVNIKDDQIEENPGIGLNIRNEFVTGVGNVNGRFIIMLDVNIVLNIDELAGGKIVEDRSKLDLNSIES